MKWKTGRNPLKSGLMSSPGIRFSTKLEGRSCRNPLKSGLMSSPGPRDSGLSPCIARRNPLKSGLMSSPQCTELQSGIVEAVAIPSNRG